MDNVTIGVNGNSTTFDFELNGSLPGPNFVVNTTDDPGDGACTVQHCSLREAINAANTRTNGATPDTITFNIPPTGAKHILVTSALPEITDPVVINATTQPGFSTSTFAPLIELIGSGAGPGVNGLTISAGGARCAAWPSTASAATASS